MKIFFISQNPVKCDQLQYVADYKALDLRSSRLNTGKYYVASTMQPIVVSALYHFVTLDDYQAMRQPLYDFMVENHIKGTLLLAKEGINGTVAGLKASIDRLHTWLRSDERLKDLRTKESFDDNMPFYRTRVKLKKEIVTMGVQGIDPNHIVGTYIKPEEWNDLISDPEVTVIDTRNDYEFSIGTFKNAVNPKTETFRQFPAYVKDNMNPEKNKKVAMFCTGGIRCEKSTAYLKEQGFEEVYHLQGGILKYLETIPEEETLWQGECFVFDNRVSVDHKLNKGTYDQCHACRLPITKQDKNSDKYVQGVSCPSCYNNKTQQQRQRFAERERQVQLAKMRGEEHIGSEVNVISNQRKQIKDALREANTLKSKTQIKDLTVALEVIFGWTASLLCTLLLVPQIVKALKTRHTDDVSMFMLILSVAGNAFWVAHATMTQNIPLIVGAGLISFMSIVLIVFKYMFDTKS